MYNVLMAIGDVWLKKENRKPRFSYNMMLSGEPHARPQGGQGAQPGQDMPQPGQRQGMPQPGQGPQAGQTAPPQDIPDTSFKKEIYRREIRCFDLKTGKELWNRVLEIRHRCFIKTIFM